MKRTVIGNPKVSVIDKSQLYVFFFCEISVMRHGIDVVCGAKGGYQILDATLQLESVPLV